MIGKITIERIENVLVDTIRIQVMDADDLTRVKFQVEMTVNDWGEVTTGRPGRACRYTIFPYVNDSIEEGRETEEEAEDAKKPRKPTFHEDSRYPGI